MSPTTSTTETLHTQHLHLSLDGKSAEVAFHSVPSAHGTILLLHEALGSVSYWKQFPHKLAQATGYNVIAYSRAGHGNSEGPLAQRTDEYYLRQVNTVIPTLLDHFSVADPVLYGHSEGAGISLLYAASSSRIRALILESPFVVSTNAAGELIDKMAAAYPGSKLQERLAHYHQHPDEVFSSWTQWAATLGDEVFPLRDFLPRFNAPSSFCKEPATNSAPPCSSPPCKPPSPIFSTKPTPTPATSLTRSKPTASCTGFRSSCPT